MSPLQRLQLRGRHVQQLWPSLSLVLLFSSLLGLSAGLEDLGCHDKELNISRGLGEQWLLPNCGGLATCSGNIYGYVVTSISTCPEAAGCRTLEEGDPSAPFPRCCPRVACPGCYSEELDRYFTPGSSWTEGHCMKRQCKLGPSGGLLSFEHACEPLGPPPSLDCEVVGQDMSRGEYPLCCAHYSCPGLCRSGETWRSVEVRGDSCDTLRHSSES